MPEFIAQTIIGIEDVASQEIKEFLKISSKKVLDGRLLFKAKEEDAEKLVYFSKSLVRVYLLVSRFKFKSLNDILDKTKKLKFDIEAPFVVRCGRHGKQDFASKDVERSIGEIIHEQGFPLDLDSPKTTVYIDIFDNECLIGIDLSIKPMHKRDYRIKVHNQSPNACVAYAMVRLSGYTPKLSLLDPFCKDGIIPIEAASFAANIPRDFYSRNKDFDNVDKKINKDIKTKINGFDPLFHNVRSCEINAKLAGINKLINWGRFDVEWLDTKFEKHSVDCVVTSPPFVSKSVPEKDIVKVYKELFHHLEFIMKSKAKLVAIAPKLDLFKEHAENDFNLLGERIIIIGGMSYILVVLERK
jgi:putative N6-adenine-specific DNA methylase